MQSITGTLTLNARLPGQWYQLETGLHYNWHRHYDPTLGRYIQPDPLGFVDGPSVYGYAGGSPHMRVDRDGRIAQVCFTSPAGFAFCEKIIQTVIEACVVAEVIIYEMAKGGKQNIDNEYVRNVQNNNIKDPCRYLQDLYNKETSSTERIKIKRALKRFNCDGKDRFE